MIIEVNLNKKTIPTDYSWQFGFGNDHAFQMHRTDFCEHLKMAADELHIRYVRFHGLFDDDMLTIQSADEMLPYPGLDTIQEHNFRQVGHVLDNVLKCGVKPFVELSFMPGKLASGNATVLHYKNNITPPKDYQKWADYISDFIHFILDRYGKEEVESWYFEVWNEPDLKLFFAGTQNEYFQMYKYAVKAIKEIDPALRVGGPATSTCRWIEDFINFCSRENLPYDFISTHHYPGDPFGNAPVDMNFDLLARHAAEKARNGCSLGEAIQDLFYSPERAASYRKGIFIDMDDELRRKAGNTPVFVTEWNSMAVFGAPVHDEKYSAAFLVKSIMDLDHKLQGYMFWCCSDIFEEIFQLNKPFNGSYGIISNDGIPKPNFWAFKMLSKLYPERLDVARRTNNDVEYAVFLDGPRTQVLVYAQSPDPREDKEYDLEIELNREYEECSVEIIDSDHCNPKRVWQELGSPDNLRPHQVEMIKERTKLQKEPIQIERKDGKTIFSTTLHTGDVKLFSL